MTSLVANKVTMLIIPIGIAIKNKCEKQKSMVVIAAIQAKTL
jgi:hypothetical protein